MFKIIVTILTISLILLYASLAVTEANGKSFFANKSNTAVDFFREAGTRFWEFEWVQGKNSEGIKI